MINLARYDEFGKNMGLPSIVELFSDVPYPNKGKIVDYLKSGKVSLIGVAPITDVVTGEKIAKELEIMEDGKYSWNNALIYYVERYNVRLPKEFEDYVLSKN